MLHERTESNCNLSNLFIFCLTRSIFFFAGEAQYITPCAYLDPTFSFHLITIPITCAHVVKNFYFIVYTFKQALHKERQVFLINVLFVKEWERLAFQILRLTLAFEFTKQRREDVYIISLYEVLCFYSSCQCNHATYWSFFTWHHFLHFAEFETDRFCILSFYH